MSRSSQSETRRAGPWALVPSLLAGALTHDFCPWANRYVYWVKHPLVTLGLAACVSLAIGLSVAHQGYVVFGGIVSVMLLGVMWPWIGMIGVRASLRFERRRAREGGANGHRADSRYGRCAVGPYGRSLRRVCDRDWGACA